MSSLQHAASSKQVMPPPMIDGVPVEAIDAAVKSHVRKKASTATSFQSVSATSRKMLEARVTGIVSEMQSIQDEGEWFGHVLMAGFALQRQVHKLSTTHYACRNDMAEDLFEAQGVAFCIMSVDKVTGYLRDQLERFVQKVDLVGELLEYAEDEA
ncbi:hypothetical protein E4695_02200 [Alcaligenaceae bacterium 429]|nr:hypothetical protein E4695_02200 [Alcaligenaceae bacterium 429]